MQILNNQRGNVLVFVTLSLVVLMMFLGLATDSGVLVWVRAQGQKRMDAAALAATAGLIHPTASARQTIATALATTFSEQNLVVNGLTNPSNTIAPIRYDALTGTVTPASDWSPGVNGTNCNAVHVSTTIPTPMFFSGVRALFGGSTSTTVDIQVGAIGHLPCPGLLLTSTSQGIAPIALRQCRWSFPADCDRNARLFQQSQQIDNSYWITYNLEANAQNCSEIADGTLPADLIPSVKVGDQVAVNNGQIPPCLRTLRNTYRTCTPASCESEPSDPACTVIIPVVDCSGSQSSAIVTGFASICFTGFDPDTNAPKWVDGSLECGEVAPSSGGSGGVCLGTASSSPILIR